MKWGSFLVGIILSAMPVTVSAGTLQSLDSLKQTAEDYILSKLEERADQRTQIISGKLDPRLRLSNCDAKLTAFTPPGSHLRGNTTVGVRCSGPKPWSIYIPVQIEIFQQAIVSKNKMARGELISEDDIVLADVDISKVKGRSFKDKNILVGTRLKTSVQPNQVIDSATICLICKGDAVVITANSDVINVTMAGVALNDGGKGDKIRIQNNASKRIIDAIITGNNTVKAGI